MRKRRKMDFENSFAESLKSVSESLATPTHFLIFLGIIPTNE